MVKFKKLRGRIREYVIMSDIYDVDINGDLTDNGRVIESGEFIDQLLYAGVITPDDAEAWDDREWL